MARKIHKTIYSIPVVYETVRGDGYVVYAPTLPGCHSQGDTLEQAEANITEAVELYLESLPKSDRPLLKKARILQGQVEVMIKANA
jgi:predicted RNase H-like HicB family nuclease